MKCSHVRGQVSPRLSGEEEVSKNTDQRDAKFVLRIEMQTFCISACFVLVPSIVPTALFTFFFCCCVAQEKFFHFHSLTLFKVFLVKFCRGKPFCHACWPPSPLSPSPLCRRPPPLGQCIDSLQGWQHTHNMPLLWDPDTFCLLLSGRGDSPPPPLPSSPSPSSFLLAAPTPTDGGDGSVGGWVRGRGARVMTEVSAWVTVILSAVVPTGPGKSMHSSPVLRLHQSALLCSQDSHSCPSRAPTVRPSQGSSYTEAVMGKKSV